MIKKISKETSKRWDSIIKNQFNDLIKIIYYGNENIPIIGSISECWHEDDITDIDWVNQNGRLYLMICSTSKDGKFIIWEINLFPDEINNLNKNTKNLNNNFFHIKLYLIISILSLYGDALLMIQKY